jgi:eukaryotic-like serine/threonine-protein kinase
MINTTISHYRVLEEIGKGGMGVVYKAEDTRLGRLVAIKFLPDELACDPLALGRLRREARAASALNHPNICTIHDIGEGAGQTYIVMEYMEGYTLKELIEQGPLPLNRLLSIATEVVEGLKSSHEHGVVHRDIKPSNIFITTLGHAKILDFGLAKMSPIGGKSVEETHSDTGGWALGSIAYMSPEQALGRSLDERSDFFSFGSVLYEMATGTVLFHGDSTGALFLAVMQDAPRASIELNPDLPPRLDAIIRRCLEKDRDLRYPHAADILADLKQLQVDSETPPSSQPRHVTPPGKGNEVSRLQDSKAVATTQTTSRAWRTWTAAAVALLLISTGIVYFGRGRTPRLTSKDTIVVADFSNTTGDSTFDETMKQAASVDLGQSPFLNVLPERAISSVLRQMGRPETQHLSREIGREVCLRSNSRLLITGSVSLAGGTYLVELKAIDCERDRVIDESSAMADNRDHVLRALEQADNMMRKKLGESLKSMQKFGTSLLQATTPSLEALREYSIGLSMRQQKGSMEGIPHMLRAVEFDPNFALAYANLGTMYYFTEQWKPARASLTRAYQLRHRVGERDRLYIEGSYYQYITGESTKAVDTWTEWVRQYPQDSYPHSRLGLAYLEKGSFDQAVKSYRDALRIGNDTPYSGLASAFIQADRLDEAKAMYQEARNRNLDSDVLRECRYIVAFMEADGPGMQGQIEFARGKAGYEDKLVSAWSDVEAYYGRIVSARKLSSEAVAAALAANTKERAAEYMAKTALREANIGNFALARGLATKAMATSDAPTVQKIAALALAKSGDVAAATRLADRIDAQFPLDTMTQGYALPVIRAGVELSRNRPAKAVEFLELSQRYELGKSAFGSLEPAYIRGLAHMRQGKPTEAANEFRKLLDHSGVVGASITGTLAKLQLARAAELMGDHSAARGHYEDFFALWKNADSDVPVLKQAKAEYAKLEQSGR